MPTATTAAFLPTPSVPTRTSPRKQPLPSVPISSSSTSSATDAPQAKKQRTEPIDESELDCAACPAPGQPAPLPGKGAACDREVWICCSQCSTWFHCICIQLENPDDFSKWYCKSCIERSEAECSSSSNSSKPPLQNVVRPPRRKSGRAKQEVDYAAIQEGMPADPVGRWRRFLDHYEFLPDRFRRMKGEEWSLDWLLKDPHALSEPVLVPASSSRRQASEAVMKQERDGQGSQPRSKTKLPSRLQPATTSIPGMLVPPPETTIFDVAAIVGTDTPVEVIDVASQSSSKSSWTIQEWAEYFATPKEKKKKILNVISLEVTGTPMQAYVEAPQLVRDLDWVTRDWPQERRNKDSAENSWPKVQRYVLMGVEGAYSDWHVDFAGSSVYYHVIWGQKTFLFAPPTPKNLAAYRSWCSSTRQDFDWLGDHLHSLTRIDIHPGETMLIPSGWLHSVYTPKNTLVVGGNFLTDWNVANQWKLVEIEEATKVPKKFRFPHLKRLSWYVAKGWHDRLGFLDRDGSDADSAAADNSQKGGKRALADKKRKKVKDEGKGHQEEALEPEPRSLAEESAMDMDVLVDRLPTAKVLEGIELVCQALLDDVELIQDPYLAEHADERSIKQQKAAREAMPVLHVGYVAKAEQMLARLRQRIEKAQTLVEGVDLERMRRLKSNNKNKRSKH